MARKTNPDKGQAKGSKGPSPAERRRRAKPTMADAVTELLSVREAHVAKGGILLDLDEIHNLLGRD